MVKGHINSLQHFSVFVLQNCVSTNNLTKKQSMPIKLTDKRFFFENRFSNVHIIIMKFMHK